MLTAIAWNFVPTRFLPTPAKFRSQDPPTPKKKKKLPFLGKKRAPEATKPAHADSPPLKQQRKSLYYNNTSPFNYTAFTLPCHNSQTRKTAPRRYSVQTARDSNSKGMRCAPISKPPLRTRCYRWNGAAIKLCFVILRENCVLSLRRSKHNKQARTARTPLENSARRALSNQNRGRRPLCTEDR